MGWPKSGLCRSGKTGRKSEFFAFRLVILPWKKRTFWDIWALVKLEKTGYLVQFRAFLDPKIAPKIVQSDIGQKFNLGKIRSW